MCENIPIKLSKKSILTIPFQIYPKDFSFYVNGEEFVTSRIIADLLSPMISKMHYNDPTVNKIELNTHSKGNFTTFLSLINFEPHFINEEEIEYFTEIIQSLQTEWVSIQDPNKLPISMDNVFKRIMKHESAESLFKKSFFDEIDFISSHFFEINEKQEKELEKVTYDTIERIIGNSKLRLKSEDQLLSFVNHLYSKNSNFSHLYEFIEFKNVSTAKIIEFLNVFNIDDISNKTWKSISNRLQQQIINSKKLNENDNRYYRNGIPIFFKEKGEFNGIIKYIQNHSQSNFNDSIEITSSSIMDNESSRSPSNVILFDDRKNIFTSENFENSWIRFDFGNKLVVPLNYSIRSCSSSKSCANLKSWILEGSNDNDNWEIVDKQEGSQFLNASSVVHIFDVQNSNFNGFRFLRLRQIAPNWCDNLRLYIDSIEFFGYLI